MRLLILISVLILFVFGKDLTLEELAEYDGTDPNKPILLSLLGIIFDVTSGVEFYGKDGAYHVFAGKDCSRATALNRMTPNFFNKPIDDLTVAQMEGLQKIVEETYKRKYPIYGSLVYTSYRPAGHDEL